MRRAILLVGCLLLVLPTPALAKKKHKKPVKLGPVVTATATGNTVSATGAISTATATCPAGKQAVGGGFSAPLTTTNTLFVTSSFRSAPNAWTVAAINSKGTGAATAFVYCRKAGVPVMDVTATGTVPGGEGQVGDARASCPAGTRLISGGFQTDKGSGTGEFAVPTHDMAVNAPPSWLVQAVDNAGGARTLTVHGYCMAKIPAPTYVTNFATPTLAMGATGTLSSPPCPAAKKKKKGKKGKKSPPKLLSAGGFAGQPTVPIEVFSDSHIDSTTWLNSGKNVTGPTGTIHLTSQGICF
jgi:hypothetical protein